MDTIVTYMLALHLLTNCDDQTHMEKLPALICLLETRGLNKQEHDDINDVYVVCAYLYSTACS